MTHREYYSFQHDLFVLQLYKIKILYNSGKNTVVDISELIQRHFYKNFSTLLCLVASDGVKGFVDRMNKYLDYLYTSDFVDAVRVRQKVSLRLRCLSLQMGVPLDKFPGVYIDDLNRLRVSADPIDSLFSVGDTSDLVDPLIFSELLEDIAAR